MRNDDANNAELTKFEMELLEEIVSASKKNKPFVYCRYHFLVYDNKIFYLDVPWWHQHFDMSKSSPRNVLDAIQKIGLSVTMASRLYSSDLSIIRSSYDRVGWYDDFLRFSCATNEEKIIAEEAVTALKKENEKRKKEAEDALLKKKKEYDETKESAISAFNNSPLFNSTERSYVIVIMECAVNIQQDTLSLNYTIYSSEEDAKAGYIKKVDDARKSVDDANADVLAFYASEPDKGKGSIDENGFTNYDYWALLFRIPKKIHTEVDFLHYLSDFLEEAYIESDEKHNGAILEGYRDIFMSFIMTGDCSEFAEEDYLIEGLWNEDYW